MLRGFVACLSIAALFSCSSRVGAEAVSLRFDIAAYQVEGSTLLDSKQVKAAVAPFEGKQRDFADIQRAIEALELAYRKAGYGAVQVYLPEQELEGGVVVLRVIESRIDKVEVTGNKHFSNANIRRSVPALQEGTTPNSRALADNLRVANESPVKQARVVLRPAAKPNDIDANVEVVDEKTWRIFSTLDNTGTEDTGRLRLGFGAQHANLFDRDHVATVQYITSPEKPDQVSIYSLGYRFPIYSLGDSIDLIAGYSDVDAGTTQTPAGPLAFAGKGAVYLARYNWLFPRRGEYEHKLVFGADFRSYDNACSVGSFGSTSCGAAGEDVRVHPLSLSYAGQWTKPAKQASFYATVIRNIPGGTDGDDEAFALARPNATADYLVGRTGVFLALSSKRDWQVHLRMDGQYTRDALVAGEQFGIGGWNSVRGFLEREVASDRGYSGSLEFYSPNLPIRTLAIDNLRFLAFYDAGAVRRNKPVPGDSVQENLSGAGLGARLGIKKNVALRSDVASVVSAGGAQQQGEVRVHFGLLASL